MPPGVVAIMSRFANKIDVLTMPGALALYGAINDRHFGGILPTIEIHVENYSNPYAMKSVRGYFHTMLGVPCISVSGDPATYGSVYQFARLLAHEMLHYYCYLHKIEDVQKINGEQWHTENFANVAKRFNLYDYDNFADIRNEDGSLCELFCPGGFLECVKVPEIDYAAFLFSECKN